MCFDIIGPSFEDPSKSTPYGEYGSGGRDRRQFDLSIYCLDFMRENEIFGQPEVNLCDRLRNCVCTF
jgi:hypothetical protein